MNMCTDKEFTVETHHLTSKTGEVGGGSRFFGARRGLLGVRGVDFFEPRRHTVFCAPVEAARRIANSHSVALMT